MQRLGPETRPFCSASETQQPFCCCQLGLLGQEQGLHRARPQVGRGLLESEGSGKGPGWSSGDRPRAQGPIRAVVGTGTRWLGAVEQTSWLPGYRGEQRACGPWSGHTRKETGALEGVPF